MRLSAIPPSPTPSSIASSTMPTASPSTGSASAKPPPRVSPLTGLQPPDPMYTPIREQGPRGGRDHRNPRPASIGIGGRLRSESPADFVGIRIPRYLHPEKGSGSARLSALHRD